ncbi:phospholipase B1, membrane-associated-like, partial [Megalops cyprinoides]|uniref:phospholipase B1, membrane-associated-like n=1 Tax=Megalops cyprinoides TaxID=118141 RepID=UPI00186540CF
SVHTLRPSDVAVLSAIGLPQSHRNEVSRVMSRLSELMSIFSPDLTTLLLDETSIYSLQQRSLLEQAEQLVLSLRPLQVQSATGWKLVLLLVSVDDLCLCSPQVSTCSSVIRQQSDPLSHRSGLRCNSSAVLGQVQSQVQEALQILHRACRCSEPHSVGELRLGRAVIRQALQDTLHRHLVEQQRYSNRDDFTVVLQAPPPDTLRAHVPEGNAPPAGQSPWRTSTLALQLWRNLLQPIGGQYELEDAGGFAGIPYPSEDRPFFRTERNSPSLSLSAGLSLGEQVVASPRVDPILGSELRCEDLRPSPSIPTSVHTLRPADIKVVAAVGDSLTAANGVGAAPNNLLHVLTQYRGLSWSIGGDDNLTAVTTLPNILRLFNPSLTGFSEGIGKQTSPQAFLNQAVAGATSLDMPGQVRILIDKMKSDSRIDFQADWKVITMFIGGNDLCDHCKNTLLYSAENFVSRIRQALDILHKEVPRTLVNLVEPLHIVPLRRLHQERSLKCPTWLVNILCSCVIPPKEGSQELQRLNDLNRAYQRGLWELVESGRYDTHSNFTVVLQPFFREVVLPVLEDGRPDRSFFTPDCFHLSQKSQSLMARALWNNMLEPLGNKTSTQDFTSSLALKCPSEASPFLRTYQNSDYVYQGPAPTPPPITNWGSDLSCTDRAPSNPVPTSVHRLRPADVKVVAALGGSTTVGFGAKAKNIFQLNTEYKGVSWSIGGDKTLESITTLPNILRKFNPSLHGFSRGQGSWQNGFNMAAPRAKAHEIPAQIENLIKAMKADKKVDFEQDWKLVTLFVGVSDLCEYCMDRDNLSPKNYSFHLMQSLDLLYREVPRVLVNVLEVLQIDGLRRMKDDSLGCSVLQGYMCPCILLPGEDSLELSEMRRINQDYQAETEYLISTGRYDGREDFTVVLQPYFRHPIMPLTGEGKPDQSFFSADCFHFSERAHAEMAISLWNNMLEPVGRKQVYNNFTHDRSKIQCPTEEKPFIFTKINSLPSSSTARPSLAPGTTPSPGPSTAPGLGPSTAPGLRTTPPAGLLHCPASLPVWAAPLLGVIGLLIGWCVTWQLFSCRERRNRRKVDSEAEMKGAGF